MQIQDQEKLTWTAGTVPDADQVVLVTLDGDSDPTWVGFWDGETWIDAATGGEFADQVVSWSPMPAGFNPASQLTVSPSAIEQLEAIGQQRLPI